jgi:hypothetical protein
VRPKHVLIEFKKWMFYIDAQKNKYSVLKTTLKRVGRWQKHTYAEEAQFLITYPW